MATRYQFGRFVLDEFSGQVLVDGRPIALQPLGFQLLHVLVRHPGRLFTRAELIEILWPDVTVLDDSLTQAVSRLRTAMEDRTLVQTVPRRGYRLNGAVRVHRDETPDALPPPLAGAADLVGRDEALADLWNRVARGDRLISLIGPAGAGKTRLAQELARRLRDAGTQAHFVDLTAAASPLDVVRGVCRTLGLPLPEDDPARRTGWALRGRSGFALILDNLEQLVGKLAGILPDWIAAAPGVTFVGTSRTVLGLPGESVLHVVPLSVADGVRLFLMRSGAPPGDPAIPELIEKLDGLPMAIELAAARARLLTPAQLNERMRTRFKLLRAPRASGRHSSLQRALDDSWDLLDGEHRSALAQLVAFVGSFSLEAAEAVVVCDPPVIDVIHGLVDQSLLRVDGNDGQLSMLLCVREYAAEHGDAGVIADAEVRHGRHVVARFGGRQAASRLLHRATDPDRDALFAALDDLIAAGRRAIARGDGDTAAHTAHLAWVPLIRQGPMAVAIELAEGARTLVEGEARQAITQVLGQALKQAGRYEEAIATHERALALADALGQPGPAAISHLNLGVCLKVTGDTGSAVLHLEEARSAFTELADRYHEGLVLNNLGAIALQRGDPAGTRDLYGKALEIFRALEDTEGTALVLCNLADLLAGTGDSEAALVAYREAMHHYQRIGSRAGVAHLRGNLGALYAELGRFDEAMVEVTAALDGVRGIGNARDEAMHLKNRGELLAETGRSNEARESLRAAIDLSASLGYVDWEASARVALSTVDRQDGHLDAASAGVDRALLLLDTTGTSQKTRGIALVARAEVDLARGEHASALAHLDTAEPILRRTSTAAGLARLLCARAEVLGANPSDPQVEVLLAEAEAIVAEAAMEAGSRLVRRLARLRAPPDGA